MATVQKRGNSYQIRVSCGYDSVEKHLTQSMTWKPEPNTTPRQIDKELNRITVEFENKVQNGYVMADPKTRMAEFCPVYLSNVEPRLSPLTLASYKRIIERYILPAM